MFREQGGQVVTLALAALRKDAEESFLYLPESEVGGRGSVREMDVVALVDGHLTLVEAKTTNALANRDVEKYKFVARHARAKRVIFATTERAGGLCETLSCELCIAQHGPNHADQAWGVGARQLIQAARADLLAHGVAVESWCHHHLIGQFETSELESFVRRPSPPLPDVFS